MTTAVAPADDLHLPTPAERPGANVVIFDGHCRFCRAQVARLAWLDRGGRLAFLSLHDPEVAKRYPDLTYDRLMKEMYVVDPSGGRHAGAEAFRYLSRHMPTLYPLAPLMHIPFSLPLWRWLYGVVARNRYLLGGKTVSCDDEACQVHLK